MRVDYSRKQNALAEVVVFTVRRAIERADILDDSIVLGDTPILDWIARDGNNPPGMIAFHCGRGR
jgi:hypothetical protein